MTDEEKAKLKEHIQNWKETSKVLETLQNQAIKNSNFEDIIYTLSDASNMALIKYPPQKTSGLIEMQKIFKKMSYEKNL
jgi:hypothetical protein